MYTLIGANESIFRRKSYKIFVEDEINLTASENLPFNLEGAHLDLESAQADLKRL